MVLIHKKLFREDRLLQIALALSLLRMVPDMLQSVPPLSSSVQHPLCEQHSAAMDYHGMTREQVLDHLSRELLTRLHPDELRNLLNLQMPVLHHPDYGDPSGDLIDHHHDLGGLMGERRWHHHSRIAGSFDGPLENLYLAGMVSSVSMKDRNAIVERLMTLAGGNINARLNGISDGVSSSESLLSEENQSRLPSTRSSKPVAMTGSHELLIEPDLLRREIFDVQAYTLVSQTSVIPNSTSSNGSRDNVLHPLTNPTPPSSVPTSPPASPLLQPPTSLLTTSTPPLSPSVDRDDLPSISQLRNTSVSPVPIAPAPCPFNGGRFPLLGMSTTGLRVNEGILLPELRAAWPYIDEYTIEDRALLQALWLQDQDLGVPWDIYEEPSDGLHQQVEEQEAPLKNALLKGEMLSGGGPDRDPPLSVAAREGGGGGGGQPASGIREAVKGFKEEPWTNLNFTLDAETGEHCPSFDYELPEDLKPDVNYSRPTPENQEIPKIEPQPPSGPSSSATGNGFVCEQTSLYSAYDHLLCESRLTQQSQTKPANDLFQEAADALLHEAIASGISENIPTVGPLSDGADTDFSIPIAEVKTEEPSEVNSCKLLTNASSDSASDLACVNISSQNLSTILGEEVSGYIKTFAESIPSAFSAGLFNNSDLNISLNEFDFEGFPEEPQVVNDNGPQPGILKEENTTDTPELSLGDSSFFFSDFDFKTEDFSNENTEQQQHSKRPRLSANSQSENVSSVLTTRIRRPSSSASSGHGTLSDDSEGDPSASNQPSASSLEQAFDLFNSIVNSNSSNNLDTSSSNNSGGGNFNSGSDLTDLGIGPESVDLGSLASLNCLNSSLDEMIQASCQHNRASQGRMGGMLRGGSMDQRWQDLASLLSLPSPSDPSTTPPLHPPPPPPPPTTSSTGMTTHHHHHHHHHHPPPPHHHHHQPPPPPHLAPPHHNVPPPHQQPPPTIHHPHALYPAHEGVGGGSVPRGGLLHNATLPPALPDPVSHNIAYANSMGASSHLGAGTSGGNNPNVSEHLGDHHHQHPHHQHHQYKMETSSPSSSLIAAAPPPAPPSHPHDMLYYQSSGSGAGSSELASTGGGHPHPSAGGQHGDGFLSSILGEDDLHLMDMAIASDCSNSSSLVGGSSSGGHYPAPYQQPPSAMDTTPAPSSHIPDPMELKYSCSMDFRGHHEVPPSLEHIHHNHTYHLSPEGPSGLPRPSQRDPNKNKARKPEPERALTRDEKRARALNLPISCDDIIHLPMDEFNERISKYDLTENQLSLIRDIRRRGKNKVAAQNCRKRKLDQIMHLAEEVKVIQSRKNELVSQYEFLSGERLRVKHKFSLLYRHIFQHLRDSDGQPYSPHEYNLQQSGDGSVLLVPKSAPHVPLDPGLPPIPSNSSKPDDDSSKGGRPSHQQPPHQHHTPH